MDTRPKPTAMPKPHADYYLGWINKIAAAATVEISEATLAVYLERLQTLSASQIAEAGKRTIDEWTEPSKMPPLAFILGRTEARPDNLPTVEEIRAGYACETVQHTLARMSQIHGGITQDEIQSLLAQGKESYWRKYGEQRLNDPAWWAEEQKRLRLSGNKDRLAEVTRRGWLSERAEEPPRSSEAAKTGTWARSREPGEDG